MPSHPRLLLTIVPTSVTRALLTRAARARTCGQASLRAPRGVGRKPSPHAIDATTEWVSADGACANGGSAVEESSLGVARLERTTPRLPVSRSSFVRS